MDHPPGRLLYQKLGLSPGMRALVPGAPGAHASVVDVEVCRVDADRSAQTFVAWRADRRCA